MAALLSDAGEQLKDAKEQPLNIGAIATHDFIGDCVSACCAAPCPPSAAATM